MKLVWFKKLMKEDFIETGFPKGIIIGFFFCILIKLVNNLEVKK
jgi:hypothetical protein